MLLKAYTVFDHKSLAYGTPFFAATDGSAVRSFQDLANDLSTTVGRHPGDFQLFCIGEYNDQDGSVSGLPVLRHIADAVALVTPQGEFFKHKETV